ncbi:type 2 lantipeptide synthetase LanM family protein [Vagococcus sp. BWB3-3]|uniref:Type 2 lantipeptide synthetase LanM family protein n=1 Tax=Vagococcus allomyrinae TaxID=2794353 RepID=A0A940PCU6_9ENTE|nr:type 2 lanthipeptide synthetase LanM family protein [Vagococcus allomyrinae]MBP1042460.1 type 2 lantipeptide synthetase LanM family protein [Vagococcus allomyrinae]
MKNVTDYQFNEFLEDVIKKLSIQQDDLLDILYLKSLILDICGKALVLMINEKSRLGKLSGPTPESRYLFFEERYSGSGKAYEELIAKYPAIYQDLQVQVSAYTDLVKQIKGDFYRDRQLLLKRGMIRDEEEKLLFLTIKGDFHNGKAVVELTTNLSKLIYKPKTVKNDLFFYKFLGYLKLLGKTNDSDSSVLNFYPLKILDQGSYGWVDFLEQSAVSSQEEVRRYYQRVGYLLSIAYVINLTDIHFENVVCQGEYPNIVDLETLFSVSMFEMTPKNEASDAIQSKVSHSVYATGMLPVLGNENQFGGDTSGILGGSFTREERVIVNPFRDDIQFKKEIVHQRFNGHIPFIIRNNQKEYCDPYCYVNDIDDGFSFGYKLMLTNKEDLKSFVESESASVFTRILLRNTMEYSALIQAAKSPVYAGKRKMIFEKIRTFDKGLAPAVIDAEINQLDALSIPFFMCQFDSENVTDLKQQFVCKLPISPFKQFLKKFESCHLDDLAQQIKWINFSIESQEKLFKDGQDFSQYHVSTGAFTDLDNGIKMLVEIIETNACIGEGDHSINWMNLGVSANDQIVFESLENDIYKGLSGIGTALLEYYEFAPNQNTRERLKLIYLSVKKEFIKKLYENSTADYSFYNGLLGELAFLQEYEKIFQLSELNASIYLKDIVRKAIKRPSELNDVLAGEAGMIIYLSGLADKTSYVKEIRQLGKRLLNSLNLGQKIASYAHGNSGLMTALVCVYQLSNDQQFLNSFLALWENERALKIARGWKDYRKQKNDYSAYWCHGATGQALARMMWLSMDNQDKFLKEQQRIQLIDELNELIDIVLWEGMTENNFCLCHGIAGNIMIANFYQVNFEKENKVLQAKIAKNTYSICKYGLTEGWICGLGSEFYSYGMMTGISGILYALIRYKKGKSDLGILLPSMI